MKTLRIKDLAGVDTLFDEIQTVGTLPFIDDTTNGLFLMRYGNLPLNSSVKDDDAATLAPLIVAHYKARWEDVLTVAGLDLSASSMRVVTESTDRTRDNTTTGNDTQKVSAYNETSLIDDSGSERQGNENETGNTLHELEDKRINLRGAFENLHYHDRLNIIRVAMEDVADFLKTDIF